MSTFVSNARDWFVAPVAMNGEMSCVRIDIEERARKSRRGAFSSSDEIGRLMKSSECMTRMLSINLRIALLAAVPSRLKLLSEFLRV